MGVLNDRVALVTGAGRGIGAAIAEGLAAEGAGVVVNDLGVDLEGGGSNAGPAKDVADGIVAKGGTAIHDNTNVTDFDGCEGMIQRTVEEFGRLDILVNVAGIVRDGMIFKMTEQQWDSVIDVHLKGTFNTTRHASTHWRENRGGQFRLINFVSGSGLFGAPAQPNYAAAKMGIIGLTFSCANALRGYGVTSNLIAPVATTLTAEGAREVKPSGACSEGEGARDAEREVDAGEAQRDQFIASPEVYGPIKFNFNSILIRFFNSI